MARTTSKKTSKGKGSEKRYLVEVNREQLWVLENMTEIMMRLICGQLDIALTNIFMKAYEKNFPTQARDADGKLTQAYWDKRDTLTVHINEFRREYWNCVSQYFGVNYDNEADILYDMHQVLRKFRYDHLFTKKEREEMKHTVMANTPLSFGSEPLIRIFERTGFDKDEFIGEAAKFVKTITDKCDIIFRKSGEKVNGKILVDDFKRLLGEIDCGELSKADMEASEKVGINNWITDNF